ncbi:MAG: xanthine dehydrogenase family protein [Treponemataceae bacterium]
MSDSDDLNGKRVFVEDLHPAGLYHAALVRSKIAHGKLRGIETPKLSHGNILIRASDIPGQNRMEGYGDDSPILAADEIKYIGEPVAILVGPDKSIVDRLASECVVSADILPANYSFEKFSSDRLAAKRTAVFGDPDDAFAKAAHIVEGVCRTGRQEHWYAEPQGAIASFSYDKLEIFTATQWPFHVRSTVSSVLDVRAEDIVVHPCEVGVHLDGKIWYPSLLSAYVALAALVCRKPVKLFLTREEDFLFSPKRPPSVIRHRSAIGKTGELLALEARAVIDVGAFAPFADETLDRMCLGSIGAYRCPNVRVEGFAVRTNTPPAGPFAGFGLAQAFFAVERHASHIAETCEIDPVDWRKAYALGKNDSWIGKTTQKDTIPSAELIDSVVTMSDYRRKWASYELLKNGRESHKDGPLRGIGISFAYQGNGFLSHGRLSGNFSVEATLEKNGTLEIRTSAVSGSRETAALWRRVAAEALSLSDADIRIAPNSTDRVPDSGPSSLSRNVTVVTRLIERCCIAIRKQRFRDPLPITVKRSFRNPRSLEWGGKKMDYSPFPLFSWGAAVVEVEINPILYIPQVRGVWLCVDGGKIFSERRARSSLENAVIHSLGWASRERIEPLDGSFSGGEPIHYDLAPPSGAPTIKVDFFWNDSTVPKGIGELPFSCVPAAFAQAVSQAAGVSFDVIPLDPRLIRDALEDS